MLIPEKVHPSWKEFLTEDRKKEIDDIAIDIGDDFTPSDPKLVLRFLEQDLNSVQVIWLGQDPYPIKGYATGRSFEDGTLKDWTKKTPRKALRNIIRVIHRMENNIKDYTKIKTYADIKKEILSNDFSIENPKDWFVSLEDQDVLFLNAYFTCKIDEERSHRIIWRKFSDDLFKYIVKKNKDIHWFLWGSDAKKIGESLGLKNFSSSRHPSASNSESNEDDFLKFDGFRKTKNKINWLG